MGVAIVKYTPELYALTLISTATALMWVPYVLARMTTHGVMRAIGKPGPGYPTDTPWADRARRAHINAIENLAVFAPLVLVGAIIDVSTKATVLSAQIYVAARLAHYVIYLPAFRSFERLRFLLCMRNPRYRGFAGFHLELNHHFLCGIRP
jgi:uncharacterized MAPEG superfamily protein